MDQSPELDQLLQQFCQLEDDDDLQAFLQDHHAALLTEEAETQLAHLAQSAPDETQRAQVNARLQLVQTLRMRQAMADLPPAERLFMAARNRQDINSLVLQVAEADLDELEALASSRQADMEPEEQTAVQQRLDDLRQMRQQLQETFGERLPLFKRLNGWIQTDSWSASAAYLQAHADELLADAAEQVLLQLLEDAPDNPTLQQHQTLLQESRTLGIEQAYANRAERAAETESSIDPDRAQALADKLAAWIQQETLDEAEAYLRQHQADLLSDEGAAVMEMLVQANAGNPQVRNHRQRLVRAHESGIDEMYAEIRRERLGESIQNLTQQGPLSQAVYQFVQIEDDDTAAALLQTQQDLLLTWDAGNLLNQLLAAATDAGDETLAGRLQIRQQQWQAARIGPTAGQTLSPTGQTQQLSDQVEKAKYEIELAAFTAIGDNAVTLNVLNFGAVTLKWRRPQMVRRDLTEPAIGRFDELQTLHQKLGENIAVVGKGRSGAVRGMPGVGKSTLAALYAQKYRDDYPGGVLWLQLGPSFTTEESVLPELSRLAAIAYSGDGRRFQLELPAIKAEPQTMEQIQRTLQNAIFTPEAVQRLLAGHGRLLVIVDDVWTRKVLPAVRRALPPEAQLLVTTRDNRVAKAVGQSLPLDVLSKADALELIRQHLPAVEDSLAERLRRIVGAHPMALQIALGDLDPDDPPSEWAEALDTIEQRLAAGLGVDPTSLPDIDPEQRLSAILPVSYEALAGQENLQRCFRALGSLAREADFPLGAAAAICDLPEAETRNLLKLLRDRNLLRRQPEAPDRWQQHTILRSYALEQQVQAERLTWAERQAAYFLEAIRAADDVQTYYLLAPDLPNLRHAFAWAAGEGRALGLAQGLLSNCANLLQSQNLGLEYLAWAEQVMALAETMGSPLDRGRALGSYGNALINAATLVYGPDRAERLKQALAAYDEALKLLRDVPLDYATTQNNRAVLLSDLATLPGEDRAERLKQALAAYDEALKLRRDVPLDYATTQNNRANLLSDLATLPGEDRAERLKQALAAYDEALKLRRDVPLDYAQTQNNRANLLSDLATLPGEDRAERLKQALAAYDEALKLRRDVPLDYATTQNNRAVLLRDLATLPGEDRAERLKQALAAYDEALKLRRDVPLDYAQTQNNRANLLSDLATLPGEDRAERLKQALAAYDEALKLRRDVPLDYATTQNNRAVLLSDLATLPGEDRAERLKQALAAYDEALKLLRDVPLDYATTQNNRAVLLSDLATLPGEDRAERLKQALAAYDEALKLRRDVPLAYAQTQNNRAVLLSDLATLPGEDRAERLKQALAAYDEALKLRRDVPLDYATTQNNRAVLLRDLATLPGEDRAERLKQALAAYDEALKLRRDVPLDYAQTQNNRAVLLRDLATLPGEDRAERLKQALAAYDEALKLRRDVPLDYAQTQNNRAVLLSDLATLPGEDRAERLKQAVIDMAAAWPILATQAEYLLQIAQTTLARLVAAMGPEPFRAAWTEATTLPAPTLPAKLLLSALTSQAGISSQAEFANRLESDLDFKAEVDALLAFAAADAPEDGASALQTLADLLIAWIKTPDWAASQKYLAEHAEHLLSDEAEQALQLLQQANPDAAAIPQHLALLRRCRAVGVDAAYQELEATRAAAQDPALQAMQALLRVTDAESFEAAVEAHPTMKELPALQRLTGAVVQAHRDEEAGLARHLMALLLSLFQIYDYEHAEQIEPEAQEQFIALHDTLLPVAEELDNGEGLPAGVRESSGWALNALGNHHAQQKEHVQAVESYSRAIAAAPQTAMLYRNRAGEHLELQQVEAARQDIEQAAQLEPEAARLPELWCGLYLALGDGPAMLPQAQRWLAAAPDEVAPYYYLALAQALTGDQAEAQATMTTYSQRCSEAQREQGLRRLAQLQEQQPALASAWQELITILQDKSNPTEEPS